MFAVSAICVQESGNAADVDERSIRAYGRGENDISPLHDMSLEAYHEQAITNEIKKQLLYAIASDGDYHEAERDR